MLRSADEPAASAFPRDPTTRLIISQAGPGQIESTQRFRYLVITGQAGETAAALIINEISRLRHDRWTGLPRLPVTKAQRVAIANSNNAVMSNNPRTRVFAGFQVERTAREFNTVAAGLSLVGSPAVAAAVRHHEPLLFVVLSFDHKHG